MSVVVNADGKVDPASITVVQTAHMHFNLPARYYAERATFWPGCLNGEAVRVRVTFPIDFRLVQSG